MHTSTINSATWVGVSAPGYRTRLKVRSYCVARPQEAFLAAELTLLAIAVFLSVWGRETLEAPILIVACGFFFHAKMLDRSIITSTLRHFWIDVLEAVSFGTLASVLLFYLFPPLAHGISAVAGIVLAVLLPVMLRPILKQLISHKKLVEDILIVGTGDLVGKLYRDLADCAAPLENDSETTQRRVSGVLMFPETLGDITPTTIDLAQLNEMVERGGVSRVVIAEQNPQTRNKLAAVLMDPRMRGLEVTDAVDFYEKAFGKIWLEGLSSEWFVYTQGLRYSRFTLFLKRVVDVALAFLLLVLTAPLLAISAIAIKMDSAGPVVFRQVRVGLRGRTFTIFKFRSMCEDAELEAGPVWAAECDERVTRVGYWLRKFRIDELFQAINVLRGEMSVVGPRPERPFFVEQLVEEIPYYDLRHYAKPGITGWAQVMYSYGASIEDACQKLQYDFYYAKHMSLACDARILLKTVKIVLFGRGR
jgi:sugar transferase (PEP-CTERM system associated)